ncbi:unnamed protein product [Penicillium salamii]|uniref:AAA+ ATPase domain-containing protein n=1 Tax=Penicillium salamii TaxID=1612424 RepID=A0A9W4K1G4_9EURO|nr:unnamed protein product [Penicillium salamii]CAG8047844.1 unnamed protein product [Penicillium salamii]CAG8111238.1 unnamed protein product [Penicillium salamii]CAG8144281.1 unnamed protein product [Penicillium salamii]CAG8173466.1 unnamed protein product [Penicillium salamii]
MAEPTEHDRVLPTSENLNGSIQIPSEKEIKERETDKDVKESKESKETKEKDAKESEATSKPVCKKHEKKKKKPVKKEESDTSASDSSSNSDSDADSDSDSESESSTDKRRRHRLRTKARAQRALKDKKRRKKKHRSRKVETSDSASDSESESDTATSAESDESLDEKALRKLVTKLKLKKRAKKLRDQTSDDLTPSDPVGEGRQKRSKKKKPASKVAYKRVDQLWDTTIHKYKLTETVDDPDADEWDQYIFNVRRKFNWENKYLETVVDIKSKHLRDALSKIMDGVKGVSLVQEPAVVDPNMLFLYLEETRQYMKDLKKQSRNAKKRKTRKTAAAKASHLKVLVKYLDTDYADTKKTLYPLLEANTITFDLLWALFKPNTIAYTPTYGNADEPRAFKIEYAVKESSFMKGQWYSVEGRYLEYDGKDFGFGSMSAEVDSFKGARKITSLACYPLKYHRDADALRTRLIERGKRFVALRGMNYRFHKGMAFYKKKRTFVIKVNINGRVMIDPAIHRRINPNYLISTVRPKDPDLLDSDDLGLSGNDDDSEGCCCGGSDSEEEHGGSSDTPRTVYKVIEDTDGMPRVVEVEVDENGNEIQKEKIDRIEDGAKEREFTEEELLVASPVVLGFAFSEKLWLEFTISGISDIEWDQDAFGSLVLPTNQKSIVKALVESHTFHAAENIDDVIQGKGKGLVAVLHGPPGTGKTLTAEGIAELLRRPLYMVSAGELGTDSRTLEAELNKILDIAHSWGAVLLLDEADVFLEKRTIHDIHRNALVSIFLRLLEYFQGILFLTTNRVETFDDAFQSRIHVALRYGDLTTKAKRSIWKMFLERVRALEGVRTAAFTDADYDMLSRHTLNGRQIKNSVRTAQALAVNEKSPLAMEHIKRVLEVAETFDQDLRGGTGYLDAMRSYT